MVNIRSLLRVCLVFGVIFEQSPVKADRISIIKNVICSHSNPTYLTIKTCRFEPIVSDSYSGNFTLDLTLLKSLDNVKVGGGGLCGDQIHNFQNPQIQVKEWVRKGSKFEPSLIDFNYNLCDLTSNLNSTQSQFIQALYEKWTPHAMDRFRHLMHPCPYSGRILFEKAISIARYSGPSAMLVAPGSIKQMANFYFNDRIAISLISYKVTRSA